VQRFKLEPYSKIMICSDGLTDMITDEEITGALARHSGAHPARLLVRAALNKGGLDNVSVVVFELRLHEH
jgi:PPM family protein phosphatase